VHAAAKSLQTAYVELVPHLAIHDPLLHHIVLLLQVASNANGVMDRLYAELLANALAVHLLQRCAACEPSGQGDIGGLPLPKLRRTIAYIQAHLGHELSVAMLAAVAQMSPAHFARLFKQATGQTPHQYVMRCRIERAKQLLVETDLSLSEIGAQVGCTDQSHFTALFRRYVVTTPRAYRSDAQR
jgi:AraC family transcriptional regulator